MLPNKLTLHFAVIYLKSYDYVPLNHDAKLCTMCENKVVIMIYSFIVGISKNTSMACFNKHFVYMLFYSVSQILSPPNYMKTSPIVFFCIDSTCRTSRLGSAIERLLSHMFFFTFNVFRSLLFFSSLSFYRIL